MSWICIAVFVFLFHSCNNEWNLAGVDTSKHKHEKPIKFEVPPCNLIIDPIYEAVQASVAIRRCRNWN